jgi:uncharacterized protein
VKLSDDEGGTLLEYAVQASVGGKLAQLGSRLIDGVARKLADQFFDNFQNHVAPSEPEPEPAGADGDETAETKKKGWLSRLRG